MRPGTDQQIWWGIGAAVAVVALIAVLALVPDPFFRQHVYATTFDDVEALTPGTPVYFRGSAVGQIRSVKLVPETRNFAVSLGVSRRWKPSACTFTRIAAANPFTAPRIEVVAVETTAQACPAAEAAATCQALAPPPGPRGLTGCRRGPDLIQTAAAAVTQATEVAKSANAIALQVQAMIPKGGGLGPQIDVQALVKDVTHTLASIDQMTTRLNASLDPGKGDIAQTLANVRQASDQAASIDMASVNATIRGVQTTLASNQDKIDTVLAQSAAISLETRSMLQNLSASLSATAANLQRTTDSIDALTARVADDPTYVIRGQRFVDPPTQGKSK